MSWPDAPPLPRPRILRQRWLELTFVHWAFEPAAVAHFFPPGTRPDTFEGRTYVGLVPFRMVGTGLPRGPGVPYLGSFLETNLRLYSVDESGRRGVVFLSLDADRLAVVATARTVFGLPYRWARMSHVRDGNHHSYHSTVRGSGAHATVGVDMGERMPTGPLEHFLTARWGLHVARAGRTWYLPNVHPPWVLHAATLTELDADSLLRSVGLEPPDRPPDHVAFSAGVPAEFAVPSAPRSAPPSDRR
ncbi:YqjF family protein [Kribbella sp. GL6]|uniref:YqjF family protein n=1 Tax=Kribbella sp. GL6 TaxID=3419765 RepID=UPI003D04761F